MAQKFFTLDEAAESLGISKDRLNELREAGQVHAYRDGASWKFKSEEVERLATELKEGGEGGGSGIGMGSPADLEDDSILLSEIELGESGLGPSSTIIGRTDPASSSSDVRLAESKSDKKSDSDLQLVSDSQLSLDEPRAAGSSDVLASGANAGTPGSSTKGSGLGKFEHLAEVDLDLEMESSKILDDFTAKSGSDKRKSDSDKRKSDSDKLLGDSDKSKSDSGKAGTSDVKLQDISAGSGVLGSGGSALSLAGDDDDDDMVLGEGSGSDITLSSSDSGIGLAAPADSGLSLDEQPLELGGSAVESLELGEDEEISLDEAFDPEAATQLKADDEFVLTPLDGDGSEGESEDSGSQVIALDSDSFDESADTLLGAGRAGAPLSEALGEPGVAALGGPSAAASLMLAPSAPELPYSVWNVLSLFLCLGVLGLSGAMMFDLMRNMWSWNETYSLNSSVIEGLMKMIPIFN